MATVNGVECHDCAECVECRKSDQWKDRHPEETSCKRDPVVPLAPAEAGPQMGPGVILFALLAFLLGALAFSPAATSAPAGERGGQMAGTR